MSRARLGLYIFARVSLFQNCFELTPAFSQLTARPLQLHIIPTEYFPAARQVWRAVLNYVNTVRLKQWVVSEQSCTHTTRLPLLLLPQNLQSFGAIFEHAPVAGGGGEKDEFSLHKWKSGCLNSTGGCMLPKEYSSVVEHALCRQTTFHCSAIFIFFHLLNVFEYLFLTSSRVLIVCFIFL